MTAPPTVRGTVMFQYPLIRSTIGGTRRHTEAGMAADVEASPDAVQQRLAGDEAAEVLHHHRTDTPPHGSARLSNTPEGETT
jgi:hypothetical protein